MSSPEFHRPKTPESEENRFTPEERAQLYLERSQYLFDQLGIDHLTKLKNRPSFTKALETTLQHQKNDEGPERRSSHEDGKEAVVMFLDLDNFKAVNDSRGHHAGDRILERVGEVLESSVRGTEDVVARFGGDEFYILFPHMKIEDAETVGHKILERINRDSELASFDIGASIGISSSAMTTDPTELVHLADLAAKSSKEGGKNMVSVYNAVL